MKIKILVIMMIAILVGTVCYASSNRFTTNVQVPEGNFTFSDMKFVNQYGTYELEGKVTNNTNKKWDNVRFSVQVYDSQGNQMMDYAKNVNLYYLKPGETKNLIAYLNDLKKASAYQVSIKYTYGEYPAVYNFSMLKPIESSSLNYNDDNININFTVNQSQIGFTLKNQTDNPIKLDWNQISYIDTKGNSHSIMHEGIKYIDAGKQMAPSIVPPTAKIQDILFPSDYISYTSGRYGGWNEKPLFPQAPVAFSCKGSQISVFMPIEINGVIQNYLFTFVIDDVQG